MRGLRERLIVLSVLLLAQPVLAADWRAKDTCTLKRTIKLERNKGKPVEVKGTLTLVARDGKEWKVKAGSVDGVITVKALDAVCTKDDDLALAMPAAPVLVAASPKLEPVAPKPEPASQPAATPPPTEDPNAIDDAVLPTDHGTRLVFFPPVAGDADAAAIEKRVETLWGKSTTFALVPMRTVRNLLQGQKKECRGDEACLAPLARKTKADFFIVGSIQNNPDKTAAISFRLIDAKRRKPIDRSQRLVPYSTAVALAEDATVDLKQIVRKLDPDQFGRLVLKLEARNAEVRIDERVVGMSPLAPRPMATGAYMLDVSLETFKPVHIAFDIEPQADTEIELKLARDDEFINAYKKKAWLYRGLAIGSFALAGAAGIACGSLIIYANIKNQDTFDRYFAAGRDLTTAELQQVNRTKASLRTIDALAITMGVVAGAALAGGIVLWVIGDDPSAYDSKPGPKAAMVPTGNGVALSGTF